MKTILFFMSCLFLFSCTEKKVTESKPIDDKKFDMYEMSEMALLMEQMFVNNQALRNRIIKGKLLGEFPEHFLDIHHAVMTDKQQDDDFFKENAVTYIKYQRLIYQDPQNAKENFNASIDACIKCHEVKCTGPIQRIKRLYIK